MKKDAKCSVILKSLSYILIPIFIILILASLVYTSYILQETELSTKNSFYETDRFALSYMTQLNSVIVNTMTEASKKINKMYQKSNTQEEIYTVLYDYYTYINTNYLLIDNETGKSYTNIEITGKTDTIEEIKRSIINENNKYWMYNAETNEINTNLENDSLSDIQLTYLDNDIKNTKYEIYTCINNKNFDTFMEKTIFNLAVKLQWIPVILIPIFLVTLILFSIYLCISIGHKYGIEGIYLNRLDRLPIEITGLLSIILITIPLSIIPEINLYFTNRKIEIIFYLVVFTILYFFLYAVIAMIGTIIIKKLKTNTLIKSSATYKIIKKTYNVLKNMWDTMTNNINSNAKVIILFVGTILCSLILCLMNGFGIILLVAFWIYILYKILKKVNQFRMLKFGAKQIYEGDVNSKIDKDVLQGELKELAIYINDIASGFSNAIEKSLKSERLKTELITNVSHDIKTPLTSIINYVDLLKKEEINNDKANEYIEILDSKSQRLKKLTEDLIEASKVSSGNVKFNIETINVKELVKQSIGEFEDKFKEKQLEIITTLPEEEINIKADSKYMYRIIENIYSNISKYALENSRVYIDVTSKQTQVEISFKNISKERLNITVDELMERFVRGDKSRTTEGSGLGISISKSLTELQKGIFKIQVDGDLFKVCLIFNQYK